MTITSGRDLSLLKVAFFGNDEFNGVLFGFSAVMVVVVRTRSTNCLSKLGIIKSSLADKNAPDVIISK
jgi:hypothetical protein